MRYRCYFAGYQPSIVGLIMGWTTFFAPTDLKASEIIRREFTQSASQDNPNEYGFEYITQRGSTVYAVMYHNAPDQPTRYFGMVFLTSRKRDASGYNFGYKDIGVECGPNACDAPTKMIAILDTLCPEAYGTYGKQWRDRVLANANRKKSKKPSVGDLISYAGHTYIVRGLAGPRRGLIVALQSSGMQYRLPARAVSNATIL